MRLSWFLTLALTTLVAAAAVPRGETKEDTSLHTLLEWSSECKQRLEWIDVSLL